MNHRVNLTDSRVVVTPISQLKAMRGRDNSKSSSRQTTIEGLFHNVDTLQQPGGLPTLHFAANVSAHQMLDELKADVTIADELLRILDENARNATEATGVRLKDQEFVGAQIRTKAFLLNDNVWLQTIDNGNSFSSDVVADAGKRRFSVSTKDIVPNYISQGGRKDHLFLAANELKEFGGSLIVSNNDETCGGKVSILVPRDYFSFSG